MGLTEDYEKSVILSQTIKNSDNRGSDIRGSTVF